MKNYEPMDVYQYAMQIKLFNEKLDEILKPYYHDIDDKMLNSLENQYPDFKKASLEFLLSLSEVYGALQKMYEIAARFNDEAHGNKSKASKSFRGKSVQTVNELRDLIIPISEKLRDAKNRYFSPQDINHDVENALKQNSEFSNSYGLLDASYVSMYLAAEDMVTELDAIIAADASGKSVSNKSQVQHYLGVKIDLNNLVRSAMKWDFDPQELVRQCEMASRECGLKFSSYVYDNAKQSVYFIVGRTGKNIYKFHVHYDSGSDEYSVTILKINNDYNSDAFFDVVQGETVDGVYGDGLGQVFESLWNEYAKSKNADWKPMDMGLF